MLVSSLYNYVRNLARGARVDLDGLERSGAVFRGGAAPLQWVVGSAQAFEAPRPPLRSRERIVYSLRFVRFKQMQ